MNKTFCAAPTIVDCLTKEFIAFDENVSMKIILDGIIFLSDLKFMLGGAKSIS